MIKVSGKTNILFPTLSPGRKLLYIIIIIGILLVLVFVSFKNLIFTRALNRISSRLEVMDYRITFKDTRVAGFNKIVAEGICLDSKKDSTHAEFRSLTLRFSILAAMRGRLKMNRLSCSRISVSYDQGNAEDSAVDKISHDLPVEDLTNYSVLLNRIIRRLFMAIPHDLLVDQMDITVLMENSRMNFYFQPIQVRKGILNATLHSGDNTPGSQVELKGNISRKRGELHMTAFSPLRTRCTLSFPGNHPLKVSFDTLLASFSFLHYSGKHVSIQGTLASEGLVLESERLASREIIIDHFRSSYTAHIRPHGIEIDSSTHVSVNEITFRPYVRMSRNPGLELDVKICPQEWQAGSFFRSLPEGMFTSLNGFQASGSLQFFLDFSFNKDFIDSLKFSARLFSDDFRIHGFGQDDYRLMNQEFMHRFYEKGMLVASFPVGPGNPEFTPLDGISPWLKTSVLTSEDGSFYYHRGFNPRAIRESMITNIQRGKFVRGGSTISMQLVKNVFLNRNKTIGRKLEELLIVWIIENNRLVSKERMFEVYLNIIEWGPGVYGVGQASLFYFDKSPAELNLQESIYLAGIIPFPKRYKSVFEANGILKNYFSGYMERMKSLMVSRNYIASEDTLGVYTHVVLSGPALKAFSVPDSIPADTLQLPEMHLQPADAEWTEFP